MKIKAKIFIFTLLSGVFLWFLDGVIDHLLFFPSKSLLDILFLNVPPHEISNRVSLFFSILAFGFVLSLVFERWNKTKSNLKMSEAQWLTLVQNAPNRVAILDLTGTTLFANQPLEHCSLKKKGLNNSTPCFCSDLKSIAAKVILTQEGQKYECKKISKNGVEQWWSNRVEPIFKSGKIIKLLLIGTDITELKNREKELRQLNQILQTRNLCNQILIHAKSEQELFDEVCKIFIQESQYMFAWIGVIHEDFGEWVKPVAHSGNHSAYLDNLKVSFKNNKYGQGPTGKAIRFKKVQVTNNISSDDNYALWREKAKQENFASSGAIPLIHSGEVIGILNIYSKTPEQFLDDDIERLEELAKDLSYGIVAIRNKEGWKKAQKALKENEIRLHQIINLVPHMIFAKDTQGNFLLANLAVAKFYGTTVKEIVGDRYSKYLSKYFNSDDLKEFDYLDDGNLKTVQEEKINDSSGNSWILKTTKIPFKISGTSEPAILGVSVDVTEIRNVEEERVKLVTAIEQAAESIVITDLNGNIQYINPAFQTASGYSREEVIGQSMRMVKSGKQSSVFYKNLWDTILKGEVWNGNLTNKRKNGTLYEENLTISPVRNVQGELVNFVGVKRDITYELALERQLRQAQKMEAIGTLAGGIAHDFNNLLFAMLGYMMMVKEDLPEESPIQEDVEEAIKAAKRAKSLIHQILAFSRQQEGKKQPIQMSSIVKEALKLLRATLPAMIEFRPKIQEDCPYILGDTIQIHQVVMNLCSNAAYAMRDNEGVLKVELSSESIDQNFASLHDLQIGDYLRLSVEDTGTGISLDVIDRIFDPFFTTKPVGEGTGMGLAAVHGIIKSHQGAITVSSKYGKQTKFDLFFPIFASDDFIEEFIPEDEHILIPGTERILVVDDEATLVRLEKQILERCGYQVVCFSSSLEALNT
ncbi:MAG: PAS domain S-box-containing protein, partial [bacterium]